MPLHDRNMLACFQANNVENVFDAMGTEAEDCNLGGMGLSAGLKGIFRKVIEKANEK